MSKHMPLEDFRAVRTVLEEDDYALSSGPEPPPSDLIPEETWLSLTVLPDEVAVRTSNRNGTLLDILHQLGGTWPECVILNLWCFFLSVDWGSEVCINTDYTKLKLERPLPKSFCYWIGFSYCSTSTCQVPRAWILSRYSPSFLMFAVPLISYLYIMPFSLTVPKGLTI